MPVTVRHPPDINKRDANNRVYFFRSQDGFDSSPPSIVLPYEGCTSRRISGSGDGRFFPHAGKSDGSSYTFHTTGGRPPGTTHVVNGAYDELRERAIGVTSSLGTFLAEWRQGLGLIGSGLGLASDVLSVLKRDIRSVVRSRISPRKAAQKAASSWLEFWFGWAPAVNDIWSGIQVIEKPFPDSRPLSGTSSTTYVVKPGGSSNVGTEFVCSYFCKQGAMFRCTNPNLALAAQLGLVNPAQIAWEIVPWSFLADWVFDVSSWIGSFSDFAGISIEQAYTTFYQHSYDNWVKNRSSPTIWANCTVEGFDHIRKGGLTRPMPNFSISANLGKSISRAASAASLLTLQISGGEPPYRPRR